MAAAPIAPLGDDLRGLSLWSRLTPREQAHAAAGSPRRGHEFASGRAALRRALEAADAPEDVRSQSLLPGVQGRPELPPGWTGSITHKDGWAYAVAGPAGDGTLGIDSEVTGRERLAIAPRILRPDELARWTARGSAWSELLEVFSVKEAIYKAMHPHVPRWIGFHEAEIRAGGRIVMHLENEDRSFALTSSLERDGDRIVTIVRAQLA